MTPITMSSAPIKDITIFSIPLRSVQKRIPITTYITAEIMEFNEPGNLLSCFIKNFLFSVCR